MSLKISVSELDVMTVIWNNTNAGQGLSGNEVVIALSAHKSWSPRTVNTLLARLVEKGALSTKLDGRRYLYKPTISKEAFAESRTGGLIDRLFEGRTAPLVAHLAKSRGLSKSDITEIKALIAKLESEEE